MKVQVCAHCMKPMADDSPTRTGPNNQYCCWNCKQLASEMRSYYRRKQDKNWWDKKTERNKKAGRHYRDRCKARGLCTRCGEPNDRGADHSTCSLCQEESYRNCK